MPSLKTAALVGLFVLPFAAAADQAEDALDARHGYMQMIGINMGQLAGMAKGEIAYDEAGAVTAAANIEALTNYALPGLFVEGTANGEIEGSDALPAIWEDPDQFSQKFAGLGEAAAGASEVVTGGQENVGPVVQKLGGACKDCHDDFRKK